MFVLLAVRSDLVQKPRPMVQEEKENAKSLWRSDLEL